MENPEPVREHRELEKLAGHFAGPERMHPSYWNPEAKKAESVTDARVALDGFAIVQDYEQLLEDGSTFAGHGVFRYDTASDTYEMHWFDSTGGAPRIFRGGFADRMLVLNGRAGDGWQRLTYDFNLDGGYRFKLETSDDGDNWNLALEGDNLADTGSPALKQTTRHAARKAAPKKAAARKTAKAGGKKPAARKAAGRKAGAKKTAGKKATAKKATARKTTAKKATAKKATARKTAARKGAAATKKSAAKKTTRRSVSGRSNAGASTRIAAVEKRRRQGKASKKIGAKTASRSRATTPAERSAVSQKRTKGAAQRAPRMPKIQATSTRTGWHRTAAKGVRQR